MPIYIGGQPKAEDKREDDDRVAWGPINGIMWCNSALVPGREVMPRNGRPSPGDEIIAILETMLADEPGLLGRIDRMLRRDMASMVRARAGTSPQDAGWADRAVSNHVKEWRRSKKTLGWLE
jgi:hypothetical protein